MTLAIRLALHGCANRPFYHIVVIRRKRARDDTPVEQLGTYDPVINKNNEKLVAINFERLRYWIAKGATPSKPTAELLGLSGFLPIHPYTRLVAQRRQKQSISDQLASLSLTTTDTEGITPPPPPSSSTDSTTTPPL